MELYIAEVTEPECTWVRRTPQKRTSETLKSNDGTAEIVELYMS